MQITQNSNSHTRPTTRSDATDDNEENEARLKKMYLLRAENDLSIDDGTHSNYNQKIVTDS
jgi:hypothetical protein